MKIDVWKQPVCDAVVVGTGLGALGATLALIDQDIIPVVVDVGQKLPRELDLRRKRMAKVEPNEWSAEDVALLAKNTTAGTTGVPRKLVFGSDYFYGSDSTLPPHSFAEGGFSAGWGAAYLPPRQEDLDGWPISAQEIHEHAERVLRTIPVSEPRDHLSTYFPPLKPDSGEALALSPDQKTLLDSLQVAVSASKLSNVAVGQSRLMTHAGPNDRPTGSECRRCGFCMSGCVYGAIFSSGDYFRKLSSKGAIRLLSGQRVTHFEETAESVTVHSSNADGESCVPIVTKKLYIGAGVAESTRIVVQSVAPQVQSVEVLRTGGAVIPLMSIRRLRSQWPNVNTQSSAFLDLIDSTVSPHWIHTQLGPSNELILQKLGLSALGIHARSARLRWAVYERLAVALVNFHSDHGPRFRMVFSRDGSGEVEATISEYPKRHQRSVRRGLRTVRRLLRRSGLYAIRPLEKDSAKGVAYHLGGSLPMRSHPSEPTHTDSLGRPGGSRSVYLIDASVLPSLPGTTLGISIMANAHRIASESVSGS